MTGFHDQRDWTGRHPAPPSLPVHDRTPSGNQAIRMVPYSPPRLESQQSQYSQTSHTSQHSQVSQLRNSQHSHSLSLPHQGRASPTPSSPRSSPRRRQRRKRLSREVDGYENLDDFEGGANDSDRTTTTVTSRRSKASKASKSRPSSWGPAAAFAAARSAVSAVTGSGHGHGSGSRPGSPLSTSSSDRRHARVLTEKSRNIKIARNWTNAKKEGYAAGAHNGQGSALSIPIGAEIPLARGSNMGVSGSKLLSPTTAAQIRYIDEHDATSSRPLAHSSQSQLYEGSVSGVSEGSEVASPSFLSTSSRPRARLGLPPASASFSAAAASYQTSNSNSIGNTSNISNYTSNNYSLHSAALPSSSSPASPASAYSAFSASPAPSYIPSSYPTNYSPSQPSSLPSSYQSSYHHPLTVTNTVASSYTLTAPSLSPSPSIGSLSSVSSSQAAAPRPHSRRRNIITIHPDKTFSLIPRAGSSAQPQSHSSYAQPPSAIPALAASLKSPPLSLLSFSQSATSSTVRSSVSHERLFSGAYGSVDQPSSPLTTAASATGDTEDASFVSTDFGDHQPWNQRLVGGLHSLQSLHPDPKTPDAKRKGKGRAYDIVSQPQTQTQTQSFAHFQSQTQSHSQSQYLPSLPETSSPTATIVTGPFSESTARPSTRSPKSKPKKKQSSASVQSFVTSSSAASALSFAASTLSATTNYKVYAHGSSPVARTALDSLDSFADLDSHDPHGNNHQDLEERLDSTDSFLYPSPVHPHPGDTTNVEILGVSSPSAAPSYDLQLNNDPEQSAASLNSYPSIASFDTGISYNESTLPNFVVIGASSPPAPSRYLDQIRNTTDSDVDIDSDIDIPSSPPLPSRIANTTVDTLDTSDSDENYVLHGEPSSFFLPPSSVTSTPGNQSLVSYTPAPTSAPAPPQTASSSSGSSLATISKPPRQVRSVYSRESLVVPPLKTVKSVRSKRSNERFGYYKSRSRESLRRAASLKSLSNSIFNQEAASTFFAGQAFLNISIPPVPVFNPAKTSHPHQLQQQLPALLAKAKVPKVKRKPLPLPAPPIVARSENIVVYGQTPKGKNTTADDSWDASSPPQLNSPSLSPSASISDSPRPPSPTLPQQPKIRVEMVEEHPHQWSSQLSTVMSESEEDSMDIRLVSPSVSPMPGTPGTPGRPDSLVRGDASVISSFSRGSVASNGSNNLRSSAGWIGSLSSRNLHSITSSMARQLEEGRERTSRDTFPLPRPSAAFFRGDSASPASPQHSSGPFSPPIRTVRDHDEDGDGLADLHDMSNQPSRSGLSGFFTSSSNSVRNLHTSGSMRSMRSVSSGHFPSWARVYYGSGEHRALSAAPSISDFGQGDDYMTGANRPNSAFRRSPSVDNGPLNLFNIRRRPREVQPGSRPGSEAVDMGAGVGDAYLPQRPRGLRRITSSIWSPHLQMDRRATRFSVWDPPSVAWSDTSSRFDRRNMQVILFTIGFIMPLTWMVASFLPLPLDPKRAMEKRMAESAGEYGVAEALKARMSQADENRFQSARWWRTLNRVMSLFGLLVLGAIIALVVIAVKQHWGQ